ncbi:hypothetical protein STRPO_0094 [Streptococcus porcinus str. Jelinkova 176]|uniref:Uncharacterized protein n=1 Tax=Streptococcus porcinus str. Jelinkova 176 TaxID=873448 RepID=A0ABP2L0L5_STRPO|nr:hypothetical protein STRPO_0094 [Streptococcus porcinus str. Jelinkova 176]
MANATLLFSRDFLTHGYWRGSFLAFISIQLIKVVSELLLKGERNVTDVTRQK